MAEQIEYDEAGNVTKVKKIRSRAVGWVTVPGGPGPDSPEAKAFVEEQRRLWNEELKAERKKAKEEA